MISFIVPARSLRGVTAECLISINTALHQLGIARDAEFVLIDDNSDQREGLPRLFADFRASAACPVHVARFRARRHYTGAFAYGLSRARGSAVLFISNDMYVTPAWLRTVLAVAALDDAIGIVRGTAEIVDSFPHHEVKPPFEDRGPDDILAFSEYMARARGLEHADDPVLSGDAVLIKRAVIERIGVMDRRFFGYFGDPDYGLRARRAGFRMVCARGAWLKHYGQGHIKAEAGAADPAALDAGNRRRRELVHAAWGEFRAKWDPSLPKDFLNTDQINWPRLLALPPSRDLDYVAPWNPGPNEVDVTP